MRVVITGGGGFLGRKLAARLLKDGSLVDSTGTRRTIEEIVLFDQIAPPDEETADERISVVVGDLTDDVLAPCLVVLPLRQRTLAVYG